MPVAVADSAAKELTSHTSAVSMQAPFTSLPFPPCTAQHIINCAFPSWHAGFRRITPKARIIPLSQPFVNYLRADGILLPPEAPHDGDSGYSDDEDDPSQEWPEVHQQIFDTIEELGGKVIPKLNWSAPKDATFMSTTNDLECRTPNDVYLLLKSSDFVTHDLEHPFDDCIDTAPIQYQLVLRKSFQLNPVLEFRVFVRDRKVIGISQREMNYFEFLFDLRTSFKERIKDAMPEFPDPNFVFDVYIPPPHEKVWIIDINPWAPRTDPLLFSWLELLTMPEPEEVDGDGNQIVIEPEFRLVQRDDPEAYQFASTKYSAHKLPKDVVDASMTPSAMKAMMDEWKKAEAGERSDDEDD